MDGKHIVQGGDDSWSENLKERDRLVNFDVDDTVLACSVNK